MKCCLLLVSTTAFSHFLLGSAVAADASNAAETTPVAKVVELLTRMLNRGKSEKHQEQVEYAAYKQFCDHTSEEKARAIKTAAEAIDKLKADIQKATSDVSETSQAIAAHDADISTWTGDQKAAKKVRELKRADFDALHKDYSESVEALQHAIKVLKKQAYDRRQVSSFAELEAVKDLKLIPSTARRVIDAFLERDPEEDNLAVSAPEASGYEFQSHGIIKMLERLLDKFMSERTTLENEETNMRHAFEMLNQDVRAQIEQATRDRSDNALAKAKALQDKADMEGDLTDTVTVKDSDEKYLSDLKATCASKASDFQARQQLRAEELEAIQKAIEIISSEAVAGNAARHLPTLLQKRRKNAAPSALVQVQSDSVSPLQERAARFLQDQADQLHSRILSTLATRVQSDPFAKVKKMIKDLLIRLMEENHEEASHKAWCDTELATNDQSRREKSQVVELLHAEIDELTASISKLGLELTELSTEVADLDKSMAEATKIRQEEKTTNTATITDAGDAQRAVAQALVVLREFYGRAGEATALVQQAPPPIFDEAYQGMQSESGGVIGMLEVIQSDFARLQAETEGTEQEAQMKFDKLTTDSKVNKAELTTDIEHKTRYRKEQGLALTQKRSDLIGTQKELDAALAYYDKLKPSCVDAGVSYEDRVARRNEEIQSLKEALRILNGEDIAA